MNTNSIQSTLPLIFQNQKLRSIGYKKNDIFNIQLRKKKY